MQTIYTDGSCVLEFDPVTKKKAKINSPGGYGVVFRDRAVAFGGVRDSTNNIMSLSSILFGLRFIRDNREEFPDGAIVINSSEYAVAMSGLYAKIKPELIPGSEINYCLTPFSKNKNLIQTIHKCLAELESSGMVVVLKQVSSGMVYGHRLAGLVARRNARDYQDKKLKLKLRKEAFKKRQRKRDAASALR